MPLQPAVKVEIDETRTSGIDVNGGGAIGVLEPPLSPDPPQAESAALASASVTTKATEFPPMQLFKLISFDLLCSEVILCT
jgi:hypothetical protein